MNFVVIDIEEDKQFPLLLGMPFLAIRVTLIDVKKGELTLRVRDETVHFNLNHTLKHVEFDNIDCKIVETKVPISPELITDCKIQSSMNENEMNFQYLEVLNVEFLNSNFESKEEILNIDENNTEKSSSNEEKASETETSSEGLAQKELPRHLKYAFLELEKVKPVVILAALTELEEQKLLEILKKYKEAIGWSIEDLKGTSPSICEDNVKTSIEHQRRLNLVMKEVIRNEVLKWMNTGFIYAVSNNPWVSPVHVVPKKGGFTIIKNEKN